MTVFAILLGLLACVATSLGLGITLLRILGLRLRRAETICLGYVVGSSFTSTLTFATAVLWIAWKGVFVGMACIGVILLWRARGWLRRLEPVSTAAIPRPLGVLFCAALLAYGALYFRQALSPEMSPDGMGYHLGLVNLWNHAHGLTWNMSAQAAKTEGVEMLFLFAFSIGRHSAAALVHWSFLMLLPWLMVLFGCRFGWPQGAAILAAILVFASPLMGVDGASAYNDVALAAVAMSALYLFEIWREERQAGALAAASLLTGFAVAIKTTSVFFALFVLGALLWDWGRRRTRLEARSVLLAAVLIAALPAPYFIRNAIWYQNPLAQFGNRIFPNRWFHVSSEESYRRSQAQLNGVAWSDLPRELTFGGDKMQESFGPAFLLLPVALLGLIWPRTRFLVLAGIAAALPFAAIKSARFLIPGLAPVTLAACYAICRVPQASWLAGVLALAHLLASWPSVNNRWHISSGWRIAYHVPWRAALRREPEDEYLQRSDEYRMARLVEANVPEGAPVLSLDAAVAQSYTLRTILVAWESAFGERVSDLLFQAAYASSAGSRTWTATFPHAPVRELKIMQTGRGDGEAIWSVNEIQLWSNGAPVPFSTRWQATAQPNPWDIGLAFDGSEATRWRSWEPLRPGMWIGVRFDRPQAIDRVDVTCHDSQWESGMAASVLTVDGQWRAADGSTWRAMTAPDLRKAATAALKSSGVRFIEMDLQVWQHSPYDADAAGWGVHQIGATSKSVLLRVD